MSVWIPLDLNYANHPKTLRLCRLLGEGADAYPIRLWTWCARYAKDGKPDASFVEEACRWKGETGALIQALKLVGFIDDDGSLHDWFDWTGAFLDRLETRREANRKHMKQTRKRAQHVDDTCATRVQHVSNTCAPIGEERREEKKREDRTPSPTPSRGRGDDKVIGRIFDHYRKRFGKRDPYSLTPKRRQKIAARVEEIGEDACLTAITRASEDNWFRDTCSSNGVETIFRSQDEAEKWASKAPRGESGSNPNDDGWLEAANAEAARILAPEPDFEEEAAGDNQGAV